MLLIFVRVFLSIADGYLRKKYLKVSQPKSEFILSDEWVIMQVLMGFDNAVYDQALQNVNSIG